MPVSPKERSLNSINEVIIRVMVTPTPDPYVIRFIT